MFKLKTFVVLFLGIGAVIGVLVTGAVLTVIGVHPILAFIAPILLLGLAAELLRNK